MIPVSGNANSYAALKTAIETACVAGGWTLSSGVLSKGGVFFKLTADTYTLLLEGGTGQAGAALTGACPYGAMIGGGDLAAVVTFPVDYDVHVLDSPDEVYVVMNYNADAYQHLCFGKSNIVGVGGTGAWFTGCYRSGFDFNNDYGDKTFYWQPHSTLGVSGYAGRPGGLFFEAAGFDNCASYVHVGLDGATWVSGNNNSSLTGVLLGPAYIAAPMSALPSLYNEAHVLLPVKAVMSRNDSGQSIVVQPRNMRFTRNDNIAPEEIIDYGGEDWKVYPMYRKNASPAKRNGNAWNNYIDANHSGTYAFAIRIGT